MTSDEIDREELERLARKAAPAYWYASDDIVGRRTEDGDEGNIVCLAPPVITQASLIRWPDTRDFIAAFNPSVALQLLAELRERDRQSHEAWNAAQVEAQLRGEWQLRAEAAEARLSAVVEALEKIAKESSPRTWADMERRLINYCARSALSLALGEGEKRIGQEILDVIEEHRKLIQGPTPAIGEAEGSGSPPIRDAIRGEGDE